MEVSTAARELRKLGELRHQQGMGAVQAVVQCGDLAAQIGALRDDVLERGEIGVEALRQCDQLCDRRIVAVEGLKPP